MPRTARELMFAAMPDHLVVGRAQPGGEQISRLSDVMFSEARSASPAAVAFVERVADAMLLKVFEIGVAQPPEPAGLYAGLADPLIWRAIATAWKAPEQRWTVESLAALAAMSRSAFSAKFTRLVGRSPLEVLTAWRMQLAWRMLDKDQASVAGRGREDRLRRRGRLSQGLQALFRRRARRGAPPVIGHRHHPGRSDRSGRSNISDGFTVMVGSERAP